MDFKKLIGITIEDIILEESSIHDDDPRVIIHADNGARFRIEGGYGEDTGESIGEFRTTLTLTGINPASNKDTLVKKKRGIRVISGNNVKKEYDSIEDMLVKHLNDMNPNDLDNVLSKLDRKVYNYIMNNVI